MPKRRPLNHEAVVAAAVEVADRGGLVKLSMRNVAKHLGYEAMSLYHHIDGKDALLDALVDWFFTQIELPRPGAPWRHAMVARASSARAALTQHPWALGLIESRPAPGPALLRHHDSVLGCLRSGGFSPALAGHAFSAIDAYVYGFVLTEMNLPFEAGEGAADFVESIQNLLSPSDYPHLVELVAEQVGDKEYAYADEFSYGLDLILDSLEERLRGSS